MKKNVVVTLADENYVNQAKQLFSSIYFNSGWKGDYLLLSHNICQKELEWFRTKGILVYQINLESIFDNSGGCINFNKKLSITYCKYFLFTMYFKKWKKIIFFDTDVIVRGNFDIILKRNGLSARKYPKIKELFVNINEIPHTHTRKILKQLKTMYNFNKFGFNPGVLVIDTQLINYNTFNDLKIMTHNYFNVIRMNEESILNIFFYKQFHNILVVYHKIPRVVLHKFNKLDPFKIEEVILHFQGQDKPWDKKNNFYQEWKNNLYKADLIDLHNVPKAQKRYIIILYLYSIYIEVLLYLDRTIGQMGIQIKKYFPMLYEKIRISKN